MESNNNNDRKKPGHGVSVLRVKRWPTLPHIGTSFGRSRSVTRDSHPRAANIANELCIERSSNTLGEQDSRAEHGIHTEERERERKRKKDITARRGRKVHCATSQWIYMHVL